MEENNCFNSLNLTECKQQDFFNREKPVVLSNFDVKMSQNSVDFILSSNNCNSQNNNKFFSENSLNLNEHFSSDKKINKNINIKNLNFHVNKKNILDKVLSSKTVINNHVPQTKKIKKSGVNHKFVNNPKQIKNKTKKSFTTRLDTNQFVNLNQNNQLITSDSDNTNKNSLNNNPGSCLTTYASTQISTVTTSKGMGCGKPGYITCSICNATKYYSHVQRRFGQFSCEPCSKFMKRFLRDPKVFICIANGVCQIGKPTGEQEPRGVSVNRCKACWLKICLDKFVIDGKTKEVIELHYMPKLKNNLSNKLIKICDKDNDVQNQDLNNNDDGFEESKSQTNLPPLPILNTRRRRTLDNSNKIVKNKKKDTFFFNKKNELPYKNKKKTKSVLSFENNQVKNENKRKRKKKKIYSPPSTPKKSKKKSLLKLNDNPQSKSDKSLNLCLNSKKLDLSQHVSKKLNDKNKDEEIIFSEVNDNENNNLSDNESNKSFKMSIQKRQEDWNNIETNYLNTSNTDNITIKEECGKCSYCVNGKNPNVLIVKNTCKYVGYSIKNLSNRESSSFSNYSTSSKEHSIVNNELNDYYKVNNNSLDFKKDKSTIYTISNTIKFEEEDEEDLNFKGSLKVIKNKKEYKLQNSNKTRKTIKRKDLLTSNNLLRKSIMKKSNLNYIFNLDSNSVNEILNANSPFL